MLTLQEKCLHGSPLVLSDQVVLAGLNGLWYEKVTHRHLRQNRCLVGVVARAQMRQYLICKQAAVQIFLLNTLDLIVDDLEHLVGHDKVILLPDLDQGLTREHLIRTSVQVHLHDLQLIVTRLYDVMHVESHALEDARQLEH